MIGRGRPRHEHSYAVAGVQSHAPGGLFTAPGALPETVVLFRCECGQPGSLRTSVIPGRWTTGQVTGTEPVPEPASSAA